MIIVRANMVLKMKTILNLDSNGQIIDKVKLGVLQPLKLG